LFIIHPIEESFCFFFSVSNCHTEFFNSKQSLPPTNNAYQGPTAAQKEGGTEGSCSPTSSSFVGSPYYNQKPVTVKVEEPAKVSPTRVPKSEAGSPAHRTFDSYLNQDSNSSSVSSMDAMRGGM